MHRPCSKCGITYYCSVICQKHHWKEGGHKKHCVAKEERSASSAAAGEAAAEEESSPGSSGGGGSSAKAKKKPRDKDNECAICLEDLDDPEFGPAQILDCTHRFHRACVEELRNRGVQQACPMCRAKLPDSAEKMFDDACTIYVPIERRVSRAMDGSWGPLSRRQQRQMDEVVRLWEGAAEQGHAEAQYNLGVMYDHGHGVDVNYKKAIEWFEKAAEQGHADGSV